MKKLIIFVLAFTLLVIPLETKASSDDPSVPYETYTIGPKGRRIKTQTAYDPAGFISLEIDLSVPEALMIKDDVIYVADTGNQRIIKLDLEGHVLLEVTHELMLSPTGVFVDEENHLYVADPEARLVLVFDENGDLLATFDRPTEPIFGRTSPYVPRKIAVGKRGNMYIVGEGSTSGIIQLNHTGEFIGFFGTNITGMTWFQRLANLFNVEFALNIPTSASNLTIDEQGMVYTVSPTDFKRLKRFNIASIDTLDNEHSAPDLVAVAINQIGNIITLSSQGMITEYDSFGNMIFEFGGLDSTGNRRLGLFVNPVDIAVDSNHHIYVLDRTTGTIQAFHTSTFTRTVHQGLISFKEGIYDVSQWEDVLALNEMFALANSAIGQAKYRLGIYDEALYYYQLAYDKTGYSNAFWQLRYTFLQNHLGTVLLGLILLLTGKKTLKFVDAKYQIYAPLRRTRKRLLEVRLIFELSHVWHMLRHPLDTLYNLRYRKQGSYASATILYGIVTALAVLITVGPAFIFRTVDIETFSVLSHTGIIIGLILLFVFANYLISTINEGEGWFKDVYVGCAYALAPFIFMAVPVILISYGLTYDEIFIYQFLNTFMYGWTALYVIIMLKEVHGYNLRELFKNIVLTFFTVVLMILLIFVVYLLLFQVVDYFGGLFKEVIARVGR